MAQQRSIAAVAQALIPVCINQSKADPEATAKLKQLGALETSYERHEGTHRRDALTFGYPARRVVQGFVKAIASARTDSREALEVSRCSGGIDHRRERRRVWRNHHVFCKTALQSEARDAEVRILISELQVACVVGGFRNSPCSSRRSTLKSSCRIGSLLSQGDAKDARLTARRTSVVRKHLSAPALIA